LHPMATLLPAVIAQAERRGGVSGRDLLTAVTVGVDVSAGLGIACTQGLRFFRPATAGGFGAAAAVARLMGMDAETIVNVFGIQLAQTSGTMQAHADAGCVQQPSGADVVRHSRNGVDGATRKYRRCIWIPAVDRGWVRSSTGSR